ncbi:MAG: T9SS type A sorting domain-containing protein, partial [Bacteroidota bacterium]
NSTVCYEDVNGDNKRDLFIGGAAGGLSFFSSASPNVGIFQTTGNDFGGVLEVYPNPFSTGIYFRFSTEHFTHAQFILQNLIGETLMQGQIDENNQFLNLSALPEGVLVLKVHLNNDLQSRPIIKKILKSIK